MAFTCGASIPAKVVKRLVHAGDDPAGQARAGIEYACEQLEDLAANGVDGLHIYSMNKPAIAHAAYEMCIRDSFKGTCACWWGSEKDLPRRPLATPWPCLTPPGQ